MKKIILILLSLSPFLVKAQYGKEVVGNAGQQLHVYLGSLPPSDGSNLQKLKVEVLGGAWESYQTGETTYYIANRNELRITKFTTGGLSDRYTLHAYLNANGNTDFYLITNHWTAMAVKSCMFGGDATKLLVNTVTESLPSGLTELLPLNIKSVLTSDHEGNMAINMAVPDNNFKLAVNGNIRAKEIKVEAANWPDYVFEEGYQVGKLKELESYIKANKHLPGMPGAKDVEANGLSVSEMFKLQQQKIEELTLHLIEKDRQIGAQNANAIKMEARLAQQDRLIKEILKKLK